MSEPEPIDRNESYRREDHPTDLEHSVEGQRVVSDSDASPRAAKPPLPIGAPLPVGSAGRPLSSQGEGQGFRSAPPAGRALTGPSSLDSDHQQGMSRAIGAILQAMPFVQRLLPLLDANIATAVSNFMTPHPAPPPVQVDLAPLEHGISELQGQQAEIRSQFMEQNGTLKRVEDQLEMVREATDRNTLEQQELIEDLKALGGKVNLFALLLVGLLVASVLLNLFLFLHIQRVLP
jgi:hypothetical protein